MLYTLQIRANGRWAKVKHAPLFQSELQAFRWLADEALARREPDTSNGWRVRPASEAEQNAHYARLNCALDAMCEATTR